MADLKPGYLVASRSRQDASDRGHCGTVRGVSLNLRHRHGLITDKCAKIGPNEPAHFRLLQIASAGYSVRPQMYETCLRRQASSSTSCSPWAALWAATTFSASSLGT